MDGRVLVKGNGEGSRQSPIPELAGWTPDAPQLQANGPVERIQPVSLIVPTFFNSELKQRSLRFLLAGLARSQAVREIIFVSSDGENRGFEDLRPLVPDRPMRVVEADPHNRGKSRNAGAEAASSPLLLFLDDDMLVKNWRSIDVIASHMLATGHECALFPRRQYAKFPLLFDPPTLQMVIEQWRGNGRLNGNPFLFDPLAEGARDLPMLFCFPGCFMLIRRDAFQRLGGFNEEFIGWGFEDTEFALRAIREVHVLNLFRQGEPLLHIDHPVSPYKSDEHGNNFRKFYNSDTRIDVNLFCRRVFLGDDFHPRRGNGALCTEAEYLAPFQQLSREGIPINARRLRSWYLKLAHRRLVSFLSPLPQFILLHGSRAARRAEAQSDYDVLCLYHGGVQSFFVSHDQPRVELECADIFHFENIAAHPAVHGWQGPMELAKVAQAQLLWGDATALRRWSSGLMETAFQRGWCFWLVLALGLRWHAAKYGPLVARYFDSLDKLQGCQAGEELDFADEQALVAATLKALAEAHPDWQKRVDSGALLFELQVPEVWIALHRLRRLRTRPRRVSRGPIVCKAV